MMIVADIGGTKAILAQVTPSAQGPALAAVRRYECAAFRSFSDLLESYLKESAASPITALGIAVAGPVIGAVCRLTNLPWVIDREAIRDRFHLQRIILLNDLVAAGYGLPDLKNDGWLTINPGEEKEGNRVLISPGTGLGEGIVHCDHGRYEPIASEGGHADFEPFDGITKRLWEFLKKTQPRVSVEDVLSGPGLYNLYRFIVSESGVEPDPRLTGNQEIDRGRYIANLALEHNDSSARIAVQLFWDILAAEAGNLALKALAPGGVYIGGGIAPKLLPLLDTVRFTAIFSNKGIHRPFLESVPIRLVIDTNLPLYGAARRLMSDQSA
jgi:glucokinase